MLQKAGDDKVLVHHNCRRKFVDTFFFFLSFYCNKIHQVTNYVAIKNKINKTRQHKTNKRKQNKTKEKIKK